ITSPTATEFAGIKTLSVYVFAVVPVTAVPSVYLILLIIGSCALTHKPLVELYFSVSLFATL
ncbi:hypothetical protein, partial [Acinetobacter baylyi]|uniref:hypothetical protein n=1 Tax=Acinetobacter baylyi TaxID=202950 RepID=UPI001C0A5AFB